MIQLSVELPPAQEARMLRMLDPKRMRVAEKQALTRTQANVQSESLQLVSKKMGIPIAKLRKRGRVTFASRAAFGAIAKSKNPTLRSLEAQVRATGKPFNVIRWQAREIKGGSSQSIKSRRKTKGKGRSVAVAHKAWGREQITLGAWIMKANGGTFVAIKSRSKGRPRGVYGPGVTQVIKYPEVLRALEVHTVTQFNHHYTQAVNYVFSPAYRGR